MCYSAFLMSFWLLLVTMRTVCLILPRYFSIASEHSSIRLCTLKMLVDLFPPSVWTCRNFKNTCFPFRQAVNHVQRIEHHCVGSLQCLLFSDNTVLHFVIVNAACSPFIRCIFLTRPSGQGPPHSRFLDHIQRRTTVSRAPLDDWLARRRDLYLTTHNTHNRHPRPRWDSNPQSQQASCRRPTP